MTAEIYAPWLAASGTLAAVYRVRAAWLLGASWRDTMLQTVIAVCAIFVAYLLTAATVLPAVEDKLIIQRLRTWGYYDYIVDYIARSLWAAGFLLVLSLAAVPSADLLAPVDLANRLFSAAWWATLVLTMCFVFVATRILLKMLRAK